MTEATPDLSPLGELLEQARKHLPLSKREAARRAGISEARWRQIVTGWQNPSDRQTPARPRSVTVVAAARAVGVDPDEALRTAGLEPLPSMVEPEVEESPLRRIIAADLSVDDKERLIKQVMTAQRHANAQVNELVDRLIGEIQNRG